MDEEINGYALSRAWFDFCFENPEKITPTHTAIYFFAIEHCNRLGWKRKFGFPTTMAMEALGIKKHQTYIKHFNDLVAWGFFKLIEKSRNQYSANIICLQNAMPKNGKALDKARTKHEAKHGSTTGQSTGQSKDSINKPLNHITNKPLNQGTQNTDAASAALTQLTIDERKKIFMEKVAEFIPEYSKEMCREFFDYWTEASEGGRKMRFEKEKVFDLTRRLGTWKKNELKYGSPKTKQSTGTLKELFAERVISGSSKQ